MPTEQTQVNDTENNDLTAISLRKVNKKTWANFKKLAVVHDMTIQEYLDFVVQKEMANVQISTDKN